MKRKGSPARREVRAIQLTASVKAGKGILMDNNIQNTSLEGKQTGTEGKTFTQEDVNRIVQERLAKERSKGNSNEDLDKRAAELDVRERKLNAVTKLREKGLPDYLADVLNMNTDDDLDKGIEAILKMKGETGQSNAGYVVTGRGNPIGVVRNGRNDEDLRNAFGLR